MMQSVSIRFENGVLEVRDETGRLVQTPRATVYLVTGNDVPVALLESPEGRHEVNVTSFMVSGAAPMIATPEIVEEGAPKGVKR